MFLLMGAKNRLRLAILATSLVLALILVPVSGEDNNRKINRNTSLQNNKVVASDSAEMSPGNGVDPGIKFTNFNDNYVTEAPTKLLIPTDYKGLFKGTKKCE